MQYPLTIPAQRSRTYPGGQITQEEDLGLHSGYRLSRVFLSLGWLQGLCADGRSTTSRPLLGFPVVIIAHGNVTPATYNTDGPGLQRLSNRFASHGYVVVKPDYRGFGQSWGTARGAYASPDYNADILNLAFSLARYHQVNAAAIGLFGHSMGAYVALSAITVAPQRFEAAVLVAGAVGNADELAYDWKAPSEADNPVAEAEHARVDQLYGDPHANPDILGFDLADYVRGVDYDTHPARSGTGRQSRTAGIFPDLGNGLGAAPSGRSVLYLS